MVKKTGLGKGLEALFNENQLTKEEEMKLKNGGDRRVFWIFRCR